MRIRTVTMIISKLDGNVYDTALYKRAINEEGNIVKRIRRSSQTRTLFMAKEKSIKADTQNRKIKYKNLLIISS